MLSISRKKYIRYAQKTLKPSPTTIYNAEQTSVSVDFKQSVNVATLSQVDLDFMYKIKLEELCIHIAVKKVEAGGRGIFHS